MADTPSDPERLILHMLTDLFQHLDVKSEIDPAFVKEALISGHFWAIKRQYTGIFPDEGSDATATDVTNHLWMWDLIEEAFAKLSPEDQKEVAAAAGYPDDWTPSFRGYDGNNESAHMSAAHTILSMPDQFTKFKGRDLNSHMPVLDRYRRMYDRFEPLVRNWQDGGLTKDQLKEILAPDK